MDTYSGTCDFEQLKGCLIKDILVSEHGDTLYFETDSGNFGMSHFQNCCEHVYIEDVVGDPNRIINEVILEASEVSNSDDTEGYESATWTFYKLSTATEDLTIRWLGTSNGYYSEGVNFYKVEGPVYGRRLQET